MKPYWTSSDGRLVIYHGDAQEILASMPDDSADLMLTDPPYGIGKAEWDDVFPTWWLDEAARLAHCLGAMPGLWNMMKLPEHVGRLSYRWVLAAHVINGMTHGAIGYGNWIPCAVYTDDTTNAYLNESDIQTFTIRNGNKPDHPSPKPLGVMKWLVRRLPGDLILDPFMGSGTTLAAAMSLGRRAIGIEIEERYCEIAARRLEDPPLLVAVRAEQANLFDVTTLTAAQPQAPARAGS